MPDAVVFHSITITRKSRIAAMNIQTQKRILSFRNSKLGHEYRGKFYGRLHMKRRDFLASCPIRWTRVICEICYAEICVGHVYYARNNNLRSKYIHLECAIAKNMIGDQIMNQLALLNPDYALLSSLAKVIT